ncbi:MAG: hypothetical protein ACRC8S_10750 [Fimbriiglobus sp.]
MGKLPIFSKLRGLAILVVVASLSGCSERLYPVSGIVTLDGKPFTNGSITLVPASGPPAFGGTDAEGRFTLETTNLSGVRAGVYKVSLNKFSTPAGANDEGRNLANTEVKSLVPERLTNAETSQLTITIPSSDGQYQIVANSK